MRSTRFLIGSLALVATLTLLASPAWAQDNVGATSTRQNASFHPLAEAYEILRARAEKPPEPAPVKGQGTAGPLPTTNQLAFMVAPDNAPVVRSFPDVNNDGIPEILVGIDESGVDNVFVIDGSSSGAATAVWSLETMGGLSGGNPYGDLSLTAVADVNANGSPDILVGTAWGGRTAFSLDGADGSIHWQYDTYLTANSGWVYEATQIGDVNSDGVPDAVFGVGSLSDSLYAVDGSDAAGAQASVLWRWAAPDAVGSVRNIGDINNDGFDDVIAGVLDGGQRMVALSGKPPTASGQVLWTYNAGGTVFSVAVMPDITGDGISEALAATWATGGGGAVRCVNGATGVEIWRSTTVTNPAMLLDLVQDIDGDGVPEVIVSSWINAVIVLNGMTGVETWRTSVGTTNGGDVWTARVIGDINDDGHEDIVAGSFDGSAYAMNGKTGDTLWAFATGNRVFSVHAVGDVNNDGSPDVAVGTQDTTNNVVFHLLEGNPAAADIFSDSFETGDTAAWSAVVP